VAKDGHLMALELTGEGDTKEDKEVAYIVKVNLKQRAKIKASNVTLVNKVALSLSYKSFLFTS
jgi:hypothetical protein